jgi:hypothetical protein
MKTPSTGITEYMVRFYLVLKESDHWWFTSQVLADQAQISPRTARAFCSRFVREGIFDRQRLSGIQYRLTKLPEKRNLKFLQQLERAVEVYAEIQGQVMPPRGRATQGGLDRRGVGRPWRSSPQARGQAEAGELRAAAELTLPL